MRRTIARMDKQPPHYPVFAFDGNDGAVISSAARVFRVVESIDVVAGVYDLFDRDGRPVTMFEGELVLASEQDLSGECRPRIERLLRTIGADPGSQLPWAEFAERAAGALLEWQHG